MVATKRKRVVFSLAMPGDDYARMTENVKLDPSLAFVAEHGRKATFLRAAIAERCEKLERERAKAGG